MAREVGVSRAAVSYVHNNDPRQTISNETRIKVITAGGRSASRVISHTRRPVLCTWAKAKPCRCSGESEPLRRVYLA
ncbi:MAG: hypothetical protein ACJ78Q_10910 [Chloroflexia bacterium]